MLTYQEISLPTCNLMSQAGPPRSMPFDLTEIDLWPYRTRTLALLRRYARASVEVGRLPSLLGREFFRARLTSYSMKNFEDVVVFVTDMEHSLDKLSQFDRTLLAMNVLEDYTIAEVSRMLQLPQRTSERLLQKAIDELSRTLLAGGVMEEIGGGELSRGQKLQKGDKSFKRNQK